MAGEEFQFRKIGPVLPFLVSFFGRQRSRSPPQRRRHRDTWSAAVREREKKTQD
jgi:hypothetical protein